MSKQRRHERFWGFFLFMGFAQALFLNIQIREFQREIRREGLSSEITHASQDVMMNLLQSEDSLRGFLVAGNREFLTPYYEGVYRSGIPMRYLEKVRNQTLEPLIENVKKESEMVLVEFENQIESFDVNGLSAAQDRFTKYPSRFSMEKIRHYIDEIHLHEDRSLRDNVDRVNQSLFLTVRVLDLSTIVMGFLGVAMIVGWVSVPFAATPTFANNEKSALSATV